ncbi:hypothetical protein OESDEN_15099, partial [Oesophagostomum dentatum]
LLIFNDIFINFITSVPTYIFRIIIEHPPVYCEQTEVTVCFATSYFWCSRYFEIDFEKFGVQNWVMDFIRPKIIIRERCACGEDCGAVYELRAQLLKDDEESDKDTVSSRAEHTWDQWKIMGYC